MLKGSKGGYLKMEASIKVPQEMFGVNTLGPVVRGGEPEIGTPQGH